MKELWLAVEGGGTSTRILLSDSGLNLLAQERGGSASPLYADPEDYARRFTAMLERVKSIAEESGGRIACAALAGPMIVDLVRRVIHSVIGDIEMLHKGESDVAFALYGLSFGISMVAGTGASVRSRNERGEHHGFGGFGPQFGDEGCGYWIGREAIAAAMRAEEGRDEHTILHQTLPAFYEIADMRRIVRFCGQSGHVSAPRVAACVPLVFDAARGKDKVAKRICAAAGRALGRLALVTAAHSGIETRPIPLVMTGGLFNGGPLILTPLRGVLRKSGFEFNLYPPVPEPTMGLLRIIHRHKCEGHDHVS